MRADDSDYKEMKSKVLDTTKPYKQRLNSVYQWIKEDKINPEQMAFLNILLQTKDTSAK